MASPSSHRGQQHCCFNDWMNLQEHDLSEMLQAQNVEENGGDKEVLLRQLVQKNVEHFQAYAQERTRLARNHVSPFFAPSWCSSLEGSLLWLAGCRPSLFIRLIYALSGLEMESQIREFLDGLRSSDLSELSLSGRQLSMVNQLQGRTIKEEDKLSEQMACLQEKIADQPIAVIAKETGGVLSQSFEKNDQADKALDDHSMSMVRMLEEADKALDDHSMSMVRMLEEADKLRINTLNELMTILSPVQAVDFLIAGKKLHICIHQWGKKRDSMHGFSKVQILNQEKQK